MNVSFKNKINGRSLQLIAIWNKYTVRVTVSNLETMHAINDTGNGLLWTTWHGQSMFSNAFWQRYIPDQDMLLMIPDDWRGESLYHWLQLIGVEARPMDLESKGMGTARKFLALAKELRARKCHNFIAPDGPEGPSFVVKPGLAFLAQKTGFPIVPLCGYARYEYSVARWDNYRIPLPFSRVHLAIGTPIYVGRKDNLDEVNENLRHAINETTLRAQAEYYESYGH